jgi:RNA polymerase-binding transcription factor DksA
MLEKKRWYTAEEEVELAQRIKKGDRAALRKINKSKFTFCYLCGKTVSVSRFKSSRP